MIKIKMISPLTSLLGLCLTSMGLLAAFDLATANALALFTSPLRAS